MTIIIIPSVPSMSGRRYCVAKTLAEKGHEVHYIMWELPYPIKLKDLFAHITTSLFPKNYRYENFTMHKLWRLPYFWPYINGWIFKHQIKQMYKKLHADIIFTQSFTNEMEVPKSLPFIYDLADDYGAPAEVYGSRFYKLAFKLLDVRGVMKRQCKNALAVTVVSEMLFKYAKQYNKNVTKLPNGIEKSLIQKILADKSTHSTNKHSMVYATGLGPWSRPIETLEAVKTLRNEYPAIELTLIGKGSEVGNIKQFIKNNHAEDYIHFLGFIHDRKELFRLINQNAIGLNISDKNKWRDASHPMKVMDYTALGKKVVSTDLTEIKALNLPNVFLFSDEHDNAIVGAMRSALNDNKIYKDIGKEILNKYSWEGLTSQLTKIFVSVKSENEHL